MLYVYTPILNQRHKLFLFLGFWFSLLRIKFVTGKLLGHHFKDDLWRSNAYQNHGGCKWHRCHFQCYDSTPEQGRIRSQTGLMIGYSWRTSEQWIIAFRRMGWQFWERLTGNFAVLFFFTMDSMDSVAFPDVSWLAQADLQAAGCKILCNVAKHDADCQEILGRNGYSFVRCAAQPSKSARLMIPLSWDTFFETCVVVNFRVSHSEYSSGRLPSLELLRPNYQTVVARAVGLELPVNEDVGDFLKVWISWKPRTFCLRILFYVYIYI